MKKIISVLCVLIITSACFAFAAKGSEGDGTVTMPRIPIPTDNQTIYYTDDTTASDDNTTKGSDWEVTGVPFDSTTTTTKAARIQLKKCSISNIKAMRYTGKAIAQTPVVKYGKATLKKGKDYTLSYKNNKNVGTATVILTGKGKYTGKVTRYFRINPKGTALKKVISPKAKTLKAAWKKQRTQTTGYELQCSTKKNFKKLNAAVQISDTKKTTATVKALKSNRKYYVRVRTYKVINGKTYYSAWSKTKAVKVK